MVGAAKVRSFFLLVCLIFLITSGCSEKESARKVSLSPKKANNISADEYAPQDTLWFGFDLRIGPKEDARIYLPLLQYLENKTGRHFRLKFAEKHEDTVVDLGKGVTHFAAVNSLSYLVGESKYGIRYLASGVNAEGNTTYNSVIFTSPDNSLADLKALAGKCIAFGARMSTHGHLVPRKMLEDEGIHIQDLSRRIYRDSHLETVKAVLNRECDAGGIEDTLARSLASEGRIKILKTSEDFPGTLIAYSKSVDSKTAETVRAALLALEPRGKDKALLVDWGKTEMPLGFSQVDELQMNKVRVLAKKYGMLTE